MVKLFLRVFRRLRLTWREGGFIVDYSQAEVPRVVADGREERHHLDDGEQHGEDQAPGMTYE